MTTTQLTEHEREALDRIEQMLDSYPNNPCPRCGWGRDTLMEPPRFRCIECGLIEEL